MTAIRNALTIAGSDSGGGAGIQADLKSFAANGVYGASAITALTAQNTCGVMAVHGVPVEFITAQLDAVFSDIEIHAVKIGMLANEAVIETVAASLDKWRPPNIVIDPVMVATSGDPLIDDSAVKTLKSALFPLAAIVTPNLHEAARLVDGQLATDRDGMAEQGRGILAMGASAVLVKGGHAALDKTTASDVLVADGGERRFDAPRIETDNTHGTGCSLSSAIAANLAKGLSRDDAVAAAKQWLTGAIAASDRLDVGKGNGPIHHFHNFWDLEHRLPILDQIDG